jgi:hypothetical protein
MRKIVECVPNFSEGRDPAKVDALVAAMQAVPGVAILDRESDADHNRCVVTLAGEPGAVAEAALAGVGKALELIDLTKHTGAHPRIGATDVVPFIPIQGLELEDCVALAKQVGREIWNRYEIPVYFYEAAAQRPDRTNLENPQRPIRRPPRRSPAQPRSRSRSRRPARTRHRRSNRRRRAQISHRLQHQSQYSRRFHRQSHRESHSLLFRRTALRQIHGR